MRSGLETIIFVVEHNFDIGSGDFGPVKIFVVEHVSLLRVGRFKTLLVEQEVDGGKNVGLASAIATHNAVQSLGEITKTNFVPVAAETFELDLLDAHFQNVTRQDVLGVTNV